MGLHLLIAAAFATDCADPVALVDDTEQAILEARWDDAWDLLDSTEVALGCSDAPSPRTLARLWIAEGVLHASTGDNASADDAFSAAARMDADAWNPDFGPAMKARFDATRGRQPVPGRIELRPELERFVGLIDGQVESFPVSVPAGLHLVQVGPEGEAMRFAKLLFLPPGENAVIDHGVDETLPESPVIATPTVPGPPPTPPTETRPTKARRTPLLIAGSAALAVGVLGSVAATTQNSSMRSATDLDSLDAAYGRQKALAYTSYGMFGTGGALLGLYFAL